ncbi:MAG TPA: secretin N-terminal domain-containing protein [Vicinamibacteria bacterium]|nr:secretin N-terminal domain-containing protein [Vicinamibacteria bacterium]
MTKALLLMGLLMQPPEPDTLIDLDVKEADVLDLLRLLAEIGEFNLVADPEVSCSLTLKIKEVPWRQVLQLALRTCRLEQERLGDNLVRVATTEQLRREYEQRRKYEEEKALSGPLVTTYQQLSYARARELAPVLEKFLSPRGSVVFDERTNTLIITDVAR